MLSIVVYGRNDAHGYNLPRRVALSLNGLAAVLDDPDDEIVFVDYNTPDELPTFPEAIADTLTDEALRRLRVIRVRPRHHVGGGRAVAEPVARNVGIRRTNPANAWILSTNTDMILLPRAEGARSRAWLDGLAPGLHHLPRFELPQNIWERLDRGKPLEALAFLRRWGGRMGLHSALRMHDFLLYDAPGDFQLFPRADIHALCGFDEAMRIGWHVDSNLAKRFALLRGPPQSCLDRLFGYHCEHTRLADSLHGHDHAEDDWRRFVDEVREPVLAGQAEDWGLAGIDLEEIRLPQGSAEGFAGFVAALAGEPPPEPCEDDSLFRFDVRDFDPRRVAPFLVDLLGGLERGQSVGYAGIAPDTHALFCRLWDALDFTGAVAVHPQCRSLPDAGNGDFFASSIFVVEVGALPDPEQDETALADLHDAFQSIVAAETERAGQGLAPRRLVILNGHRNRLSTFIDAVVAASRGPSVSRLKHGFVIAPGGGAELLSPQFVRRHLGRERAQGVPVTEAVRLLTNLDELASGDVAAERAATILHGAASLASLCRTQPVRERYGASTADRMLSWVEENRASSRLASRLTVPVVDTPARRSVEAPGRLATAEDWDDPDFLAVIRSTLVGRFAENQLKRCRTDWEVAHILAQLGAQGLLAADTRVLVVTNDGNHLPAALSRRVGQVDVLPTGGVWAPRGGIIRRPERIRMVAAADAAPYDVVCLTGGTSEEAETRIAFACDHVRPGGLVALAAEVPLDAELPAVLGGAPLAISRVSLDMCLTEPQDAPHFVALRAGRPVTTGCWFFERGKG